MSLQQKILVLVVDDSAFERQFLTNELGKYGYAVETAADGRLALERMSASSRAVPDIVLMDAIMPVMEGFSACREISALPQAQWAPVLMVTSREDSTSIDQAFESGAEDYVVKPVNIALLHRRISRIVKARQADTLVRDMAYKDALTGLPNRRMFEEELGRLMKHAVRYQETMAVVLLDLDKFKQVNDRLGHAAGDTVLRETARRLLAAVRASDFVYRLGGDEFLMILPHVGDAQTLAPLMRRVVASCEEPVLCEGQSAEVGVSMGISFFPADACDVVELMRKADVAMYRSKEKNGSTYTCWAE